MSGGAGRAVARAACVAVALVLAGACGVVPDGDPAPSTSEPVTPSTGPSGPDATTDRPTALQECPTDKDAGEQAPSGLGGWEVATPSGFVETGGFTQFAPVEGEHEALYLVPRDGGFPDALGVAYYPQLDQGLVTDACGRLDVDAVLERIALQLGEAGERVLEGPDETEIGGWPAWEVLGDVNGYRIRNYFVYGHDELLHVECQWVTEEDLVDRACEELVGSLTW